MSTYLELTNNVLTLLNEAQISEQNFDSARGLHNAVKLNVKNVVGRINKHYLEWPFNAAEHTMNLVVGQEEYGWPQNFKSVDWNSFFLSKDSVLNIETTKLLKLNRDDWYQKLKVMDYDKHPDGRNKPKFVFEAHGRGFGVSPSPDHAYEIKFRYFVNPPVLLNANDTCTIPEEWEFVIYDGVMYYMKMFKENSEIAAQFEKNFRNGLRQMRTELINQYDYVQDTRVDTTLPGSNAR